MPGFTLTELAVKLGGALRGSGGSVITGVADLLEAGPTEASWVSSDRYAGKIAQSRAGVVLVGPDFPETTVPSIVCPNIQRAVATLLSLFARPISRPEAGIHPTAVIHETARIGADVAIGPFAVIDRNVEVGRGTLIHAGVFIGRDSRVGEDCVLWPHVVVRDGCVIGNRVVLHPCAVIGSDGFGYHFDEGRHVRVPHTGGVIIGDDVEVGACSCVDRSKFGNTIVGRGTKIDNLVQVGHNVQIGENCVVAAQTGIAGSARVGSFCVFGGKAGVTDNLSIGDGARLAGGVAIATRNVPPGTTISGFPGRDHREHMRELATLHRLPALLEQIRELKARVERLEAAANNSS